MSWEAKRIDYTDRLNNFPTKADMNALITDRNNALIALESSDLSQQQIDAKKSVIRTRTDQINAIKTRYTELFNEINTYLKEHASDQNLSDYLAKISTLQQEINRLENTYNENKVDVETAIARDELLRSRNVKRNAHTLFLLDRPVRKQMIPYLWVLGIAFIGIGLIMVKIHMPEGMFDTQLSYQYILDRISEYLLHPLVLLVLLLACIIVIIFLSLKVSGVF